MRRKRSDEALHPRPHFRRKKWPPWLQATLQLAIWSAAAPLPLFSAIRMPPYEAKLDEPALHSSRRSKTAQKPAKMAVDKLALAAVQYRVELAQGERQCCHCISSLRATSRCTSSFATNCARSCTQAICAPAIVFPPVASSLPCWEYIAPPSRMPTPSLNPKASFKATSAAVRISKGMEMA